MRILILSANTGGGHNSASWALAEQFDKMNVACEIADCLSFISEKMSDFISWGHSYVYRKHPRLFGAGYRFEERHTPKFIYARCAKGADALHEKILEGYDAVVCTHVFSGLMMTAMREKFDLRLPTYFVSTDYTCSPGVSEILADVYFIPHRMLLGEFIRGGISADKLQASGIPIGSTFYEVKEKDLAREELSLPQDKRLVVLSCGSMGAGKLEKSAIKLFEKLPEDVVLVVMCGNNEKTYETLRAVQDDRLIVVGFTDRMADYMSAADLYITKPGGLTTSEAIAKRLPMAFINAVPGCETRNFNFLIQSGVACGVKKWRQLPALILKLLRDPSVAERQKAHMELFTQHKAAEIVCRQVVSNK